MLVEFSKAVALLLALCLLQGLISQRWSNRETIGRVLSGLLFGGVCAIGMMTPIEVTPGVIFDARSVVLSMAGLFGGVLTGGIAAVIAGGYRAWLGGGGATVGVAAVISCTLLGLAYRYCYHRGWLRVGIPDLLAFGLLVHLFEILLFSFLPGDVVDKVMEHIALPLVLTFAPATALLGILLRSSEQQVQTAHSLTESERRYRSLVEESQLGVRIDQPGVKLLFVNDALARMFGFKDARDYLATVKVPGQLIAAHDRKRLLKNMEARQRGERVLDEYEYDGMTKGGTPISVQVFAHEIMWDGVPAVLRTFIDISRRRTAEKEARESQDQYRHLIETLPDAIYIQVNGRIEYVNSAACRLFGAQNPEQLIGTASIELFHPECHDTIRQRRELSARAVGPLPMIDTRNCRLDGTEFIGQSTVTGIRWNGQKAILVVVRDISEQKQAEELLAKAKESAEAANLSKSQFLATMSHEIRTPMNGVLGMADLLSRTTLTADQADLVQTIRESGRTLLDLLNDILDLSKIEAGRIEIHAEDFSLAEVLRSTNALWAHSARDKGLVFSIRNDAADIDMIRTDRTRLRQVLNNLIGNAIKFTADGSVELRVDARTGDQGKYELRFEVRDTGIGISNDQMEELFQPFTQADSSTTRQFGGTGLGLTISKNLVEFLGGEIGLESAPGAGSTFWFTVPADRAEAIPAEPALSLEGPGAPSEPSALRPLRILIAEDNGINQLVVSRMIAPLNAKVDIVDDGLEAVSAVTRSEYDLILMDIQMPEMDGVTATARIRSLGGTKANVPIIAMTANAMRGDREKYLEAGMNDYLAKPLEQAKLLSAISRHTGTAMPDIATTAHPVSVDPGTAKPAPDENAA